MPIRQEFKKLFRARAVVRMKIQSDKKLKTLFEALRPETVRSLSPRSRVSMKLENSTLILEFEAQDTSALRASMNSYLRWINSMSKVLESIDKLMSVS